MRKQYAPKRLSHNPHDVTGYAVLMVCCILVLSVAAVHEIYINTQASQSVQKAPSPSATAIQEPVQRSVEPVATENPEKAAQLEEYELYKDTVKRLVIAEAGNQGYDGMRGVAQVIWCRRWDTNYDFGDDLYDICVSSGQFATPYAGDTTAWEPTIDEALEAVFVDNDFYFDVPVHYFYVDERISAATRKWFETKTYVDTLGDHTFRSNY